MCSTNLNGKRFLDDGTVSKRNIYIRLIVYFVVSLITKAYSGKTLPVTQSGASVTLSYRRL